MVEELENDNENVEGAPAEESPVVEESQPSVETPPQPSGEIVMTRKAFDALPADSISSEGGMLVLVETGQSIRLV